MNADQKRATEQELRQLLDSNDITAGMTLRVQGSHFVLCREDPDLHGPFPDLKPDDRVRLTHLGGARFGLSVRRHTGRWEKTPFSGNLPEMVDVISAAMQHLVARW